MKYHLYELLMRFLIDGLIDDMSLQRLKELPKDDLKKIRAKTRVQESSETRSSWVLS